MLTPADETPPPHVPSTLTPTPHPHSPQIKKDLYPLNSHYVLGSKKYS